MKEWMRSFRNVCESMCFSLSSTFVCPKGLRQREKKKKSVGAAAKLWIRPASWSVCVLWDFLPPKWALSFHVKCDRQLWPSDRLATTTNQSASEKEKLMNYWWRASSDWKENNHLTSNLASKCYWQTQFHFCSTRKLNEPLLTWFLSLKLHLIGLLGRCHCKKSTDVNNTKNDVWITFSCFSFTVTLLRFTGTLEWNRAIVNITSKYPTMTSRNKKKAYGIFIVYFK